MKNVKMKKQAYQQKKTNGKTTNRISNKESSKILRRLKSRKSSRVEQNYHSSLKLLSLKSGILDHTRRICTKIPTKSDPLTRRRSLCFLVYFQ